MSNLAMAAHHHKHHGTKIKLPHVPAMHQLEAKLSSLLAVAQGKQGPGPQRMFFIGVALLIVVILYLKYKRRAA